MIKKALTTIGLILLLTQVAFSANQYKTPPNNIDDWDNKFLVLLADDSDATKSRKVIEKTIAKDYLKMPLGVFKQHQPISASTFITMGQLFSSAKNKRVDEESAREKLGRYLVIGFPDGVDLEAIFDAMKNNPDIAYVSVMDKRETHVNIKTDNQQDLMTQNQDPPDITEDRFWGFNKMKAAQAHNYVKGHSYIGVTDLGISTSHPDLIDYSGNTWKGGNFHPGLSFRVGAVSEAGSQANPYSGAIAFGQVDEYNQFRMLGDSTCNGYVTGPTTEIAYVGHGSHVAGIIAANGDNGLGVVGVYKSCPLSIAQHNRPAIFDGVNNPCLLLFDPLTHPDMSNIEARTSQTLTSVYASIGFLIDAGVEVVNYSGGYFLLDSDLFVDEGIAINLVSSAFCTQNPNDSTCLVLEYAQDREVVIVASAGNYAVDQLDFPANDPRVFGVSGLQNTSGGAFWAGTTFSANATANDFYRGTAFGSSFGTNSTTSVMYGQADITFMPD
ncbi:MAG: S8 family serine peptidase [Xanthomonadales bacterium]|nr:S8 family serine peptidase [Xanthomonadales bacterium]